MADSAQNGPSFLVRALTGPPAWVTLLASGFVGALSVIDYLSGSELSFSIFYLVPILYAAWYAGRVSGSLVAVVSAVTWAIVDVSAGAHYSSAIMPVWNGAMRLAFFLMALWLLSELRQTQARLVSLANTDTLTGVGNPRSFYVELDREIERSRRYGHPFAVAYIDLDHFKEINDRLGHAAGDALLRGIAVAIARTMRDSDTVARLGGDEFAILMPETQEPEVTTALERVRLALLQVAEPERAHHVNVTIGAIVFTHPPDSADAAIRLADELMYEGKRGGRATVKVSLYGAANVAAPADAV